MSRRKVVNFILCALVVIIALLWCFPIIYMVISSFKPEEQVGIFGFLILNRHLKTIRQFWRRSFLHFLKTRSS